MPKPKLVTLNFEDRGIIVEGLVSDEMTLSFSSFFMSDEEIALCKQGKIKDALESLAFQREKAMQAGEEDEWADSISQRFIWKYGETEVRERFRSRIAETFPDLPRQVLMSLMTSEIVMIVTGILSTIEPAAATTEVVAEEEKPLKQKAKSGFQSALALKQKSVK